MHSYQYGQRWNQAGIFTAGALQPSPNLNEQPSTATRSAAQSSLHKSQSGRVSHGSPTGHAIGQQHTAVNDQGRLLTRQSMNLPPRDISPIVGRHSFYSLDAQSLMREGYRQPSPHFREQPPYSAPREVATRSSAPSSLHRPQSQQHQQQHQQNMHRSPHPSPPRQQSQSQQKLLQAPGLELQGIKHNQHPPQSQASQKQQQQSSAHRAAAVAAPSRSPSNVSHNPPSSKFMESQQAVYRQDIFAGTDQVHYYKNQVQELKHAIQNHASAMGVEVSSVMDRCVTGSSDSLLLQETRLLVMRNHAQSKSFERTLLDVQNNIPSVLKKALQDQEQILERFSAASVAKLERIQSPQNVVDKSHARIATMGNVMHSRNGFANLKKELVIMDPVNDGPSDEQAVKCDFPITKKESNKVQRPAPTGEMHRSAQLEAKTKNDLTSNLSQNHVNDCSKQSQLGGYVQLLQQQRQQVHATGQQQTQQQEQQQLSVTQKLNGQEACLEEQIRQIEEHIHRTKAKIGEGKEYSRLSQGDSDSISPGLMDRDFTETATPVVSITNDMKWKERLQGWKERLQIPSHPPTFSSGNPLPHNQSQQSRQSPASPAVASHNTQNTGDVEISGHNTRHSWKSRQVEMM